MPLFDLPLHRFPPFVPFQHNKENQDQSKRKQFLMPTERSDVAAHFLSPPSFSELKQKKKKGEEKRTAFVHIYAWLVSHIDAHLCLSST